MEEFSVQPLSEGLGFYEKSPVWNRAEQNQPLREQKTFRQSGGFLPFPDIPEELLPEKLDLEKEQTYNLLRALLEKPYLGPRVQKTSPFLEGRREPYLQDQGISTAVSAVLDRNKASPEGNKLPTVASEPAQPDLVPSSQVALPTLGKKIYFSWKAVLTDTFIVSLVFFPPFVLFMFLTETLSFSVLRLVWPPAVLAFGVFAGMYCLLCRLFCFETYGEAVAQIRLAPLRSTTSMLSPFSLFWRFLLSCSTGMALLPLFSFIFKKDIAGHLTGLYIQKVDQGGFAHKVGGKVVAEGFLPSYNKDLKSEHYVLKSSAGSQTKPV